MILCSKKFKVHEWWRCHFGCSHQACLGPSLGRKQCPCPAVSRQCWSHQMWFANKELDSNSECAWTCEKGTEPTRYLLQFSWVQNCRTAMNLDYVNAEKLPLEGSCCQMFHCFFCGWSCFMTLIIQASCIFQMWLLPVVWHRRWRVVCSCVAFSLCAKAELTPVGLSV